GDYQLHPVLLDACCQVVGAAFLAEAQGDIYLPVGVERVRVYRRPSTCLWSQGYIHSVQDSMQPTLTVDLCLYDESGAMVAQVEGLTARRTKREVLLRGLQKDLGDWLYEIAWQPETSGENPAPMSVTEPGSWLIFADQRGVGQKLAQLLQEYGEHCVLVSAGQAYEKSAVQHYSINPAEPRDFQQLLHECMGEHPLPYRGIVHLWSLEETLRHETTLAAIENAQLLGCGSVLHLVQALSQVKWSVPPRLWLVTRGAQPIKPGSLQVQQAPLWGLGRVIALEHPDLHCVCLDLEPSGHRDEVQ